MRVTNYWILLTNKHFQDIAERNACTKFEDNWSAIAISGAQIHKHIMVFFKPMKTCTWDQDRRLLHIPGSVYYKNSLVELSYKYSLLYSFS